MNPVYQKINGEFNRTIVIGDIHGCYKEMRILLNKIKFNSNDLLIAVGDLVDRGSYSWKVASFFKNTKNAHSVLGNHERRIAGVIRRTSHPAWSQLHTLSKISKEEHDSWAQYFESLPAIIETPHAIITHARLNPNKNLIKQKPYYTCAIGGGAIKIETDDNGVPLWFHQWKINYGVSKPICIGHIGYKKIELEQNSLFALDTGAVKGNQLTAVILPESTIVSVDCLNYYDKSLKEWKTQEFNRKFESLQLIPLHEISKISQKKQLDEYDSRLLTQFNQLLEKYNFESKIGSLRKHLISRFGELPLSGEKRGDYFKKIWSHLDSNLNKKLINFILSDKPYQLDKLIQIFQKNSLEDISLNCSAIDEWVNN